MPNYLDDAAAAIRRLTLPDIPEGYVRLTHVMPDRSRQILSSGEPFIYKRYGLDGTTDAYSSNDNIEWLARTGDPLGVPKDGKPSNYSRNDFGNHIALMDLPSDAHKRIFLSHGAYSDPIPNEAILGFVDRKAMAFEPNPRYDRAAIDSYGNQAIESIRRLLEDRNARFARRPSVRGVEIPVKPPSITPLPDSDVW